MLRRQLAEAGRDLGKLQDLLLDQAGDGGHGGDGEEQWAKNYENAPPEAGLSYLSAMMGLDISVYDLDKPLPPDLPVQGMIGKLLQYTEAKGGMTLREVAKHEAMHETYPIVGTPEQVADAIEEAAEEGGADGSPTFAPRSATSRT